MITKFLKSSLIHSVAYDKYKLEVNLRSGHTYLYYEVPYQVYEGLINAESPGRYYNQIIKNKFSSKKIF